ncbi:MAG: NAD(P)-dependent oxidoreductase [Lentisphaerae bacterium]|nr:NAD(P)-dependent oxidoreductase [Lentisphaerota bacterium]
MHNRFKPGCRVLVLGHTGKLGRALVAALEPTCAVTGWNSADFDARHTEDLADRLQAVAPEVVLNTVALMGLDRCWAQPEDALRVNAIFPRQLARLAPRLGFTLAHFSSESIFGDAAGAACAESTVPGPVNMYGLSKYGGESFVRAFDPSAYVFRLPLLFGPDPRRGQLVERMVDRLRAGDEIAVSADVVTSPTYTVDIAQQVCDVWRQGLAPGIYHIANAGRASLYELFCEIAVQLGLAARIRPASYRDFPQVDQKNLCTPLVSEKLPPLRSWQAAVAAWCGDMAPVGGARHA